MICSCRLRLPSRPVFTALLVGAAVAVLSCTPFTLAEATREYAVIASPGVPDRDLTLTEVRRLFQFNQRYWSGTLRVNVLILEDDLRDDSFLLRKIYNRDEASLRRYILGRLYQGDIDRAPKVVATSEKLLQFVASGQGVVAILPASEVGDAKVQVLAIDGLRPGEPDYILRD